VKNLNDDLDEPINFMSWQKQKDLSKKLGKERVKRGFRLNDDVGGSE